MTSMDMRALAKPDSTPPGSLPVNALFPVLLDGTETTERGLGEVVKRPGRCPRAAYPAKSGEYGGKYLMEQEEVQAQGRCCVCDAMYYGGGFKGLAPHRTCSPECARTQALLAKLEFWLDHISTAIYAVKGGTA